MKSVTVNGGRNNSLTYHFNTFRFALRGKSASEGLYKEILNWSVPLADKNVGELQLLLWCLKVCPKSDAAEWEGMIRNINFPHWLYFMHRRLFMQLPLRKKCSIQNPLKNLRKLMHFM